MADPSLATATHGSRITVRTSSSDMVWKMPLTLPPSSAMMSMQVSIGSASPRSRAISAMRLPSTGGSSPCARGPGNAVPAAVLLAQVAKSLSS